MPNESAFPKSLIAAALSAAFPTYSAAQSVAKIDFAAGAVTASTADGRSRTLIKGADVQVGETVTTQDGRAQMRFRDGAYVSLQPQTQFKVENYVFDGRGSSNENAVMSLLKGGMRTITGLIGKTNRDGYKVQTTTATIGIRGTEYSVTYDAGGSVSMFVAGGAIAVSNQAGTTVVPAGQSVRVDSQNSAPETSDEKPFLPPDGNRTQIAAPQNPIQDSNPLLPILTGTIPLAPIADVFTGSSPSSAISKSVTLNAAGALTSVEFQSLLGLTTLFFQGPSTQVLAVGSANPVSAGNDGVIAWGRWIGGVTSQGNDLATNGPYHYVVGLPVTNMPTSGVASYSAMGATAACAAGCTTAEITNSKLEVNFGNSSGTWALGVKITGPNGSGVSSGNGSISNFSGTLFEGDASLAGPGGSYSVNSKNFFAGPGASRVGTAFTGNGSSSLYEGYGSFSGVIAHKKQ